jgi:hypothetical protein
VNILETDNTNLRSELVESFDPIMKNLMHSILKGDDIERVYRTMNMDIFDSLPDGTSLEEVGPTAWEFKINESCSCYIKKYFSSGNIFIYIDDLRTNS